MLSYLGFIVTATLSLIGLLGAATKKFRFATSIYGGSPNTKLYNGNKAILWGIIFFVSFGAYPALIIFSLLSEGVNSYYDYFIYPLLTLISLALAYFSRKYGVYKVE